MSRESEKRARLATLEYCEQQCAQLANKVAKLEAERDECLRRFKKYVEGLDLPEKRLKLDNLWMDMGLPCSSNPDAAKLEAERDEWKATALAAENERGILKKAADEWKQEFDQMTDRLHDSIASADEWKRRARELWETIEAIAKHQETITGSMAQHSTTYRIAKGMLGDSAKWFEESSE